MLKTIVALVAVMAMLVSCSNDDDDYGYAEMTAEICDVYTSSAKTLAYAIADDDSRLNFQTTLAASWATKTDTVYRALLYYNKVHDEAFVQPVAAERVMFLAPVAATEEKEWMDVMDPLSLDAAWYAKNGRYLNLRLSVKSGNTEDDKQKQSLGLVCDTVMTSAQGRKYCYRLCHAQNDVPTYYTVEVFASVPTDDVLKGDTLSLTVPTWGGVVVKNYIKQ